MRQIGATNGWPIQRLGEATEIVSGVALGRDLRGRPTRRVPYLRVANVKDGHLDLRQIKETDATDSEIRDCRLEPGDILLTEGGDADKLGRGTFWEGQIAECIHQNHIFRVRADPSRFDPQFLAYQFGSAYGKKYFLTHAKQTTGIASINKTVLSNFPLLCPPLAEQCHIAARLREQLAEVATARAAVETQRTAVSAFADSVLREEFAPEKVEEWPRRSMESVCSIVAKQVDPRIVEFAGLPHVSAENIASGRCRLANIRTAAEDGMISGKYLFEAGDVLYSKLRPYLRKAVVAPFRGLCSADMYPLTTASDVHPNFLAWLLVAEDFTEYAVGESQRSRMPKLNREELFAWDAPVPELDEQRMIAARIEQRLATMDLVADSLDGRQSAIERMPATLLRQAFTRSL